MAESSLSKMDLKTAEIAFVKTRDYYGIEFVKKLQNIPVIILILFFKLTFFYLFLFLSFILKNQNLKKAEIAAYFNRFDEAESIYLDMDRK